MVRGHEIVAVGEGTGYPHGVPVTSLGNSALLPGLINAHTHLEFSDRSQPIGFPGIKLHDWIELVVGDRRGRRDPGLTIARGDGFAFRGGARLIGEIATTPWAGFRGHARAEMVVFCEVLGLSRARADDRLMMCSGHFARAKITANIDAAISPHAPYSTSLATVIRCVDFARKHDAMVAMHIAESVEERELMESGTGPFAKQLSKLGFFQAEHFGQGQSATLRFLHELSKAPSALIVHGNDLQSREIDFLANQPQMTVVYCPRTHFFFQHARHPVAELIDKGIRVVLGTDSLASNPDLSIWNEVRWLLLHRPDIPWQETLAMATLHGADAFGRSDLGRICPGARSGLISVPGDVAHQDELPGLWIENTSPPIWRTS
jgi:cytosine/adenosine deaminase-related metal-dependent hydrolase